MKKIYVISISLVVFCIAAAISAYYILNKPPLQTTLRIWQTETDPAAIQVLQEMKNAFEKKHPDVVITFENIGWSSLSSKIYMAIRNNNPPDITHLEPFMVYDLYREGRLIPISDVINTLEKDRHIFPGVRDLQLYAGDHYGLAYAVGTTSFAYRKDFADKLRLTVPRTWDEYVNFVSRMDNNSGGRLKLLLPGGDPFFMDQLFGELLANNGGTFFVRANNQFVPKLNSINAVQVLEFLARLAPHIDPNWRTQRYLDQFPKFARGEAGNVMVTYARAFRAIEKEAANGTLAPDTEPNPSSFALMRQPTGPLGNRDNPISTVDCEPYVIFRAAEQRRSPKTGTSHAELAKEFLRDFFYDNENYGNFTSKVPIHLTPIFEEVEKGGEYSNAKALETWKQWADLTSMVLRDKNNTTRPILMPVNSEDGRKIPGITRLHAEHILSDAMVAVLSGRLRPQEAANQMQLRAERLGISDK